MDFMKRMKITRDGYSTPSARQGFRVHMPIEVSLMIRKYDVTHFDVYVTEDGVFLKPLSQPADAPEITREWNLET